MNLNEKQKIALARIYHDDSYQTVLDVLESICAEAENAFIGEHPVDEKAVLSSHAILYAQRAMFQKFALYVDKEMGEYLGTKANNNRMDPEYKLSQILSSLPELEQ